MSFVPGSSIRGWVAAWKHLRRTIKSCSSLKKQEWGKRRLQLEEKVDQLTIKANASGLFASELSILRATKEDLDNLYNPEDLYWRQRAKKRWVKEEDHNTRYFHLCASIRRRSLDFEEKNLFATYDLEVENLKIAELEAYISSGLIPKKCEVAVALDRSKKFDISIGALSEVFGPATLENGLQGSQGDL
ncbi:hypothetical protein Cni_G13398 [Canna indica]|uniref:Uncharacterized protein n=1 Tax=Canna indica TaxID=4628 RepID=A0AAQ3KFF8_9LILI|nr:hypothetical protein Cni_G13398 [Canna indica]